MSRLENWDLCIDLSLLGSNLAIDTGDFLLEKKELGPFLVVMHSPCKMLRRPYVPMAVYAAAGAKAPPFNGEMPLLCRKCSAVPMYRPVVSLRFVVDMDDTDLGYGENGETPCTTIAS